MQDVYYYINRFKKLRVDRSHGIAPHKPILLLCVLQQYLSGFLFHRKIHVTPELVNAFRTNWSLLVRTNHQCKISYPFYHLKTEKFWKLIPKHGFENTELLGNIMSSFNSLKLAVDYAEIDQELFVLMLNRETNLILQQTLLDYYFPETQQNFKSSSVFQQQLFAEIETKILHEDAADYKREINMLIADKNEEEIYLRGSVFKREIPKIYNTACCISGMRIDTAFNISMIDACHIIPFSSSYDDTVNNGIALCPNLHRAFDRGLITIDDEYRVRVSEFFHESDTGFSIRQYDSKEIILPLRAEYFPFANNLKWHRENVFKS